MLLSAGDHSRSFVRWERSPPVPRSLVVLESGVRAHYARSALELGLIWTQHPPVLKLTLSLVKNWTVTAFRHCIPSFRPEADSANAAKPSLHCSWAPEAGDGLNKAHTPPSLCNISKSLAPVFSLICPFSTRSGAGQGGSRNGNQNPCPLYSTLSWSCIGLSSQSVVPTKTDPNSLGEF